MNFPRRTNKVKKKKQDDFFTRKKDGFPKSRKNDFSCLYNEILNFFYKKSLLFNQKL
jgi:hypothetical protein